MCPEIRLLGLTTPSPGAGLDLQVPGHAQVLNSITGHPSTHWHTLDLLGVTSSLQKSPALQLLVSLPTRAPLLTDPLTSHLTRLLIGNKLKFIFLSQAFCP